MIEPISVDVDLEIPAAYVTYKDGRSVETRDVFGEGTVAYDVDDGGNILGIEILWIGESAHVEAARAFAAQHGLAFPRDLGGNLAVA